HFRCDLGGAHRRARLFCLHLAIGGRLGIARSHARCSLRGATVAHLMRLRLRLLRGRPFAVLVLGDTPAHFLLPRGFRIRLAECAQLLFPSGAGRIASSPPPVGLSPQVRWQQEFTIAKGMESAEENSRPSPDQSVRAGKSVPDCPAARARVSRPVHHARICYADLGLRMRVRFFLCITLLALWHSNVAGQTLTNALPPPQSGTTASSQPSSVSAATLPDDPVQEAMPVAEPEPAKIAGVPVSWNADRQTWAGNVATLYGVEEFRYH